MRPWLQAGLFGGLLLMALTTFGAFMQFVPPEGALPASCCLCVASLGAYTGVGAIAAHLIKPPRSALAGAGQGALAGTVAGIIEAGFDIVFRIFAGLTPTSPEELLAQMPPEQIEALRETGLITLFSPRGMTATLLCSISLSLVVVIICAMVGGMLYAIANNEPDRVYYTPHE
jgi:hypothetical protein